MRAGGTRGYYQAPYYSAFEATGSRKRSSWRRLWQRLRALWRWGVVRQVRAWLSRFAVRPEPEEWSAMGEIRDFPQNRWP